MVIYISRLGDAHGGEKENIRVWRSLVSRLNGVQEAAGSNPVTRTKQRKSELHGDVVLIFHFY